jgi:hypothetical protein
MVNKTPNRAQQRFLLAWLAGCALVALVAALPGLWSTASSANPGHSGGSSGSPGASGTTGSGFHTTKPVQATIRVDFTQTLTHLPQQRYGTCVTGYGRDTNIVTNSTHRTQLTQLGLSIMRIELAFAEPGNPASRLVCGGSSCNQDISGADWISAIRSTGADPIVILPLDGRRSQNEDLADATNIYQQLVASGNQVTRFIVGNEPDHPDSPKDLNAAEYSTRFNQIATALHQLNPDVLVGGPALSYYNTDFLDVFLARSGSQVDFIDFHKYGQGNKDESQSDEELVGPVVRSFAAQLSDLRQRLDRALPKDRRDRVSVEIGEFNLDWDDDPRLESDLNTTWTAAVVGTVLKGGALPIQYGDTNGRLGLTLGDSQTTPGPAYHGFSMFTGAGLFRPFGNAMARTTSSNQLLYVFASQDSRNIVVVNATTTSLRTAITTTGLTQASVQQWVSEPGYGTPHPVGGNQSIRRGTISVNIPARGVTTLVIGT